MEMCMEDDYVLRRVIRETVAETLRGIGFDLDDLHETQADMHYLRRVRTGSEELTRKLRTASVTILVTTGLMLIWEAFKARVRG
jgi:hypothetical protein